MSFSLGIAFGLTALLAYGASVAPIRAPYAGVTVLLARIFFKEKLDATQYLGIALIVIAIMILSA